MSRYLPVALAQKPPLPASTPISEFAADVEGILHRFPQTVVVAYPELHLCGVNETLADKNAQLSEAAEPLHGARTKLLAELAADLNIWLLPGSVCERSEDRSLFNTALAFSPQGELVAWYRKVFPWRPYEPYAPGDKFVVFDAPGIGRLGFSICYDTWFPEVARHLAWMGAEVIVNPVQTTTSDRAQEVVLTRANAIVNQVFVVSINAAGDVGTGHSLIADPEGRILVEAPGSGSTVLTDVLDLDAVTRTRELGTAGLNRMWDQFTAADAPIELPLYQGRIDPTRWTPATPEPRDAPTHPRSGGGTGPVAV